MVPFAEVTEHDGDADLFSNNKLITEDELYFHVMNTVSPLPLGRAQAVINTLHQRCADSVRPPSCGNKWCIWIPSFETWLCAIGFVWVRWVHKKAATKEAIGRSYSAVAVVSALFMSQSMGWIRAGQNAMSDTTYYLFVLSSGLAAAQCIVACLTSIITLISFNQCGSDLEAKALERKLGPTFLVPLFFCMSGLISLMVSRDIERRPDIFQEQRERER